MRMDVSGVIMLVAGLLANAVEVWFVVRHGYIVASVGTFVSFLGWVFIISGARNLNEVRKDKKARRKVVPVVEIEPHPAIQEPRQ